MAPHTMIDGVPFSAAVECKKMMEIDGTEGAKSVVKSEKRESNRKVRKYHYWVRPATEELSGLKYTPPKAFSDEGKGIMAMHHVYCHPKFPVGLVAVRPIPCHCQACKSQLSKEWVTGVEPHDQPMFQNDDTSCKYHKIFQGSNKWYFIKLSQKEEKDAGWHKYMDDEADYFREELQEYVADLTAPLIKVGGIGAVATKNKDTPDGYYLVQWTGKPYPDQETKDWLCEGIYLNEVPLAKYWYTKDEGAPEIHDVRHVVLGQVKMEKISPTNPLPRACNKKSATQKKAMKISADDHEFILEEFIRREALENPVYDDEEEGESPSAPPLEY